MGTISEEARARMAALLGVCDTCGKPAVGSKRKIIITGSVQATPGAIGFDANGSEQVMQKGDFMQTSKPSPDMVRYCAEHKPKENA